MVYISSLLPYSYSFFNPWPLCFYSHYSSGDCFTKLPLASKLPNSMEIFQLLSYWTSVEHSIILEIFSLWLITPYSPTLNSLPLFWSFFPSSLLSLVNAQMSQHSSLAYHSNWFKYLCGIAAIFTLSKTTSSQFQTGVSNLSHRYLALHSTVLPCILHFSQGFHCPLSHPN